MESVVIAQAVASTPSGLPAMLPFVVTVIAPPLLMIGPVTGSEMVWVDPVQAARAAPGAPSAASAMSKAPGRRPARERPPPSHPRFRFRPRLTRALMTFL